MSLTKEQLKQDIKNIKPNLTDNSLNKYVKDIFNIYNKYTGNQSDEITDLDIFKEVDNIDTLINNLAISTQRNFYTAIFTLFKSQNELIIADIYGKKLSELNIKQKEKYENNEISDKTKKKLEIKFKALGDFIIKLNNEEKYETALMLALITKYLFRNEIATLKTIQEKEYNNLNEEELKDNYIVLKNKKPLFISRGIYKTDKKYGIIKTKLEDKLIIKIFKKHYEKMTDNIVFKDANGNQMNSKSISKKIGRITEKELGVSLGTSSIAKISIEEINKNPQALKLLKELGESRGTSINVLLSAYFNNYP
tara:strand:+ start:821 stop:1747 length:927 start_codon:yes stop_codon:yes gene_type:complete